MKIKDFYEEHPGYKDMRADNKDNPFMLDDEKVIEDDIDVRAKEIMRKEK